MSAGSLTTGCGLMSRPPAATTAETAAPEVSRDPVEPIVIVPSRVPELAAAAAPAAPTDLIDRLRAGFTLPETDERAVATERAWFARHPDYVARVLRRGERYLHHIAERLDERGIPSDLALLPIVESAFDPFAYSRGRASGLWQIIPGTGKRFGLKQNWWYDGRRDVVDSTRAALDYLELLHEQFDGDWLLAVAGYNSGEGHVARAVRKARAEGRSIDFWSIRRDLPAETRAYVPRLLAIRDLVADAERYQLELPAIDNAPYFAVVDTEGQIDLALAAELGSLDIDTLYELNPGINRWATDPDGPHRLLVPVAAAEALASEIAALDPSERVRWTRHEIAQGESLIQIAARYETTPAVLRELNGISGHLIRAGDHLMVPHASAGRAVYSQSLEARTARTQNRERDGRRVDYRVQPGDSLWSIARRHGVGTRELASWNAMAPGDVLGVGRDLVIWSNAPSAEGGAGSAEGVAALAEGAAGSARSVAGSGGSVAASVDAVAASFDSAAAVPRSGLGPAQVRRVNYVVRSGDSLYEIATRFRVSVDELLDWNSLSADNYLQPGQSLVLYVDVTAQSS